MKFDKKNKKQPGRSGASIEIKAHVIALHMKNLSVRQIATRTGLGKSSVHRIIQESNAAGGIGIKRRIDKLSEYWDKNRVALQQPEAGPLQESAEDKATKAKGYKLAAKVVRDIKALGAIFLSQRSAIQTGAEILCRLESPLQLNETQYDEKVPMSYKLPPRTIAQIDRLSEVYGGQGNVLLACTMVLESGVRLRALLP
jgi:hypothetical protein